jgi:hypothetical protein
MISGTLQGIGNVEGTLQEIGVLHANLTDQEHLACTLQAVGMLTCVLAAVGAMTAELTIPKGGASPAFTGAYEYTPSQSEQVIPIEGYKAIQNITINPIPQNYGLITWNGSTITVS